MESNKTALTASKTVFAAGVIQRAHGNGIISLPLKNQNRNHSDEQFARIVFSNREKK